MKLAKNKIYILACSYGPDSMALLNMAICDKLNIVVAHVNYHHRDISNQEQKELKKYCEINNVKFETIDAYYNKKQDGNFEAWAREIRYKFFSELVEKYKAEAVLVAHQQDDLIETYLMQKKRGNYVKNWGIAVENEIFNVKIIRPLLTHTKQELLEYNQINNVPYSIDITNLTNDYERNKIRHNIVEKLTHEERTTIINQIKNENTIKIERKTLWGINEFESLTYEETVSLLDFYISKIGSHTNLSRKRVDEIKKALLSKKPYLKLSLTKSIALYKTRDVLEIIDEEDLKSYSFSLESKSKFDFKFISVDFTRGASDRNVSDEDYPLTIKNLDGNETIEINGYKVKIRRLFIDWKMPLQIRKIWPGIFNKNGKLIYVPRYREKFEDNHSSKFIINLKSINHFGA